MSKPVRAAVVLGASVAVAALAAGPAAACTHGGGNGGHGSSGGHSGYQHSGDHHATGGYAGHANGGYHSHRSSGYGTAGPAPQPTSYGTSGHHCHGSQPTRSGDTHPSAPAAWHHGPRPTGHHPAPAPGAPTGGGVKPTAPTPPAVKQPVSHTSTPAVSKPVTVGHAGGGLWPTPPASAAGAATPAVHTVAKADHAAAKKPARSSGTGLVAAPVAAVSAPSVAVPTAIDAGQSRSALARLARSPLDIGLVLVGLMLGAAGVLVRLRRAA